MSCLLGGLDDFIRRGAEGAQQAKPQQWKRYALAGRRIVDLLDIDGDMHWHQPPYRIGKHSQTTG